jgi:hypothetical protein
MSMFIHIKHSQHAPNIGNLNSVMRLGVGVPNLNGPRPGRPAPAWPGPCSTGETSVTEQCNLALIVTVASRVTSTEERRAVMLTLEAGAAESQHGRAFIMVAKVPWNRLTQSSTAMLSTKGFGVHHGR